MKLFDRFLLAVGLILLLALSVGLGCVALSVVPIAAVAEYLASLAGFWTINAFILGAAALVLFLLTVRLIVALLRKPERYAHVRLTNTENGEVAIAIATIKQIVSAFISLNPDILASSSVVLQAPEGLALRIRICPKEGTLLPGLTTSLQQDLKQHLATVTGLPVKEIGVLVDNNRASYSGKV